MTRIGRDESNQLQLNLDLVSRRHAELYPVGTQWRIKDLGSSNGTYLNGHLVSQAFLPAKATLQFGSEGPIIRVERESPGKPANVVAPQSLKAPPPPPKTEPADQSSQPSKQRPGPILITPILVTTHSDGATRPIQKFSDRFTLGSADVCDITLTGNSVSSLHAEIYFDDAGWCVRNIDSDAETLLNGVAVSEARLPAQASIQLGHYGPLVQLQAVVEKALAPEKSDTDDRHPPHPTPPHSIDEIAKHYFDDSSDREAGEHTIMVRRAFQQVKKKQSRRYRGIIGFVALLLVASVGVGVYQFNKLQQTRKLAVDIFYNMKAMSLQISQIERLVQETGERRLLAEIENKRQQLSMMEEQYDQYLEESSILDATMSEEERIITRMARLFGECELNMPEGFVQEVQRYIIKWQASSRFKKAMFKLHEKRYAPLIYRAMTDNDIPPQFMYLALQESNLDLRAIGPPTRFGIAKGIWQFIPGTARDYGLKTGPLVDQAVFDPEDERFSLLKSTRAAARFLRDIYETDAQASGLLVMASYNWGPTNIKKRIKKMPENPRDRNFWNLLKQHKIPKETYDYVFYIFSASVIGENPGLFGFDFENPLEEYLEPVEG
ncbi:MAG: FHA domain-containing protein [Gammaproteobacteria bacterium]|nr:FHA domain-containing protein [Gammaproteobacteria bacterium]